ncbi:MAG TPA: NAD(P)H-quinone oxidoreductase [Chthoniobacterales bacterium]|jgi:putative PIG3 family NAD(P)H quinone oxidoreductase
MRAVVITSPGGGDKLKWQEVDSLGEPAADRVRVRVHAAGLNRADILQREGKYPAPPGYPADIPGLEFAGEIEAVGEMARRWKVGARVFGITAGGAQAEFVVVPESNLARIPAELSFREAAAVPEAFITAHDALFIRAQLRMGERVLIHAAGSGVGTAAVQMAHLAGAFVYGTSRNAAKLEKVRELGLDEAIPVAGVPSRFADALHRLTNGVGADVILDLVGGAYLAANLRALASRGRLVCVGTPSGATAEIDLTVVLRKRANIMGTMLRTRSLEEKAEAVRSLAAHVVPLLALGDLRPVIDRVFPAADVRAAHEHLESNQTFGKVVLDISGTA